jgi:hypothetical protein
MTVNWRLMYESLSLFVRVAADVVAKAIRCTCE